MSWDTVPGRNGEGYPDPTASTALARVQHSQKGLQSKRAGEHFENMITASLNHQNRSNNKGRRLRP